MGLLDLEAKGSNLNFNKKSNISDDVRKEPPNMKAANERHDFKNGFFIKEIVDGKESKVDSIVLRGSAMPHDFLPFGGTQKIKKDYYPGNSEPTVQVLGPRESDIRIKGKLKAKNLPVSLDLSGGKTAGIETVRSFPQELQQKMEAMRLRGNVLKLQMGEWVRYAFMESAEFDMFTIAEIKYRINFSIIGFNPPGNCKISTKQRDVPFRINKELIDAVNKFTGVQVDGDNLLAQIDDTNQEVEFPEGFNRNIASRITDLTESVATSFKVMTDYVNDVLAQVDAVKDSVARAQGLIQAARNSVTNYITALGGFDLLAGSNISTSISAGINQPYINSIFIQNKITEANALTAQAATMAILVSEMSATTPLSRHRVQDGDTLQKLAVRYFNDVTLWNEIFEHNKLVSTDLSLIRGTVIEIPKAN